MTKPCIDSGHVGERDLPASEFYGSDVYCKTCRKRHSTADQNRRRQARREQGLPVSDMAYENLIIRRRLGMEETIIMETLVGAFKECIDSKHIDAGPLSPLGDFYASSPNICKACKRRDAREAGERYRARRKAVGLPDFIGMRTVENVEREEEARKLQELELAYRVTAEASNQHSVSEVQAGPVEPGGVGFHLPESEVEDVVGFQSETGGFHSLISLNKFLHQGKPKPTPRGANV